MQRRITRTGSTPFFVAKRDLDLPTDARFELHERPSEPASSANLLMALTKFRQSNGQRLSVLLVPLFLKRKGPSRTETAGSITTPPDTQNGETNGGGSFLSVFAVDLSFRHPLVSSEPTTSLTESRFARAELTFQKRPQKRASAVSLRFEPRSLSQSLIPKRLHKHGQRRPF
jgi:hypothetical protein